MRPAAPLEKKATTTALRIGISGWRYARWRGVFYPADLAQRNELHYASRCFNSIEINGTFYGQQRPASFERWRDTAPDGFVFALKGPRFITHTLRLRNVARPLANFFASGVLRLGDKLGPLLWQLPPSLRFDADTVDGFLALLPRSTAAACALVRQERVAMQECATADSERRLRHAIEARHPSFFEPACMALLRQHGVALVIADTAGRYPYAEDVTADFLYLRLHGDTQLYTSRYGPEALQWWARRIAAWSRGGQPADARTVDPASPRRSAKRDVYCYFDNDAEVHAPFDALALAKLLKKQ